MRTARRVGSGLIAVVVLAAALASAAPAAAVLVLKSGGQVAPAGTLATGVVTNGGCDKFESSGTLTANNSNIDRARFTTTTHTGYGCGEGGPEIAGPVIEDRLTETGRFVVVTNWTYTTILAPGAVNEKCTYAVRSLHGKFTIPGPTQAAVSGTGNWTSASTGAKCPEKLAVKYLQAQLYDAEAKQLFEAEP